MVSQPSSLYSHNRRVGRRQCNGACRAFREGRKLGLYASFHRPDEEHWESVRDTVEHPFAGKRESSVLGQAVKPGSWRQPAVGKLVQLPGALAGQGEDSAALLEPVARNTVAEIGLKHR